MSADATVETKPDAAIEERANILAELAKFDQSDGGSETKSADSLAVGTAKPETKAEAKPEDKPQEKTLTREEKSNDRLDRSWEKLNEEKARIAKEREDAERIRRQGLEEIERARESRKFSPEDYEAVAKSFEAEGREDQARLMREKANSLREAEKIAAVEREKRERAAEWDRNLARLVSEAPELKDPDSELTRAVSSVLKSRPILTQYPGGIVDAVEVARVYVKSLKAESLEKELSDLRAKVADYEKRLQPTGGEAFGPDEEVAFDKLPEAKQRDAIMRALASHDSSVLTLSR